MNAERDRDIPRQPHPACPIVDQAKAECDKVVYKADDIQHSKDLGEIHELAEDAEKAAHKVEGLLEDLRNRCEELRAWGQGWKDYALSTEEV